MKGDSASGVSLAYLVAVKHPHTSVNYRRTWRILNDTVASLCVGAPGDVRVIVVCDHKLPWFHSHAAIDTRTEILQVDYGPPWSEKSTKHGIDINKGLKYIAGMAAAREMKTRYTMIVDADDFVHRGVRDYLLSAGWASGWVVVRGYILKGFDMLNIARFDQSCGSSRIFHAAVLEDLVPRSLSASTPAAELLRAVDDKLLRYALGNHQMTRSMLSKLGHEMKNLPFPCAVWHIGTGDNVSGRYQFDTGYNVVPDAGILDRFNIYACDMTTEPRLDGDETLVWNERVLDRAGGFAGDPEGADRRVPGGGTAIGERPRTVAEFIEAYAASDAPRPARSLAIQRLFDLRRDFAVTLDTGRALEANV